MTSGRNLFMHRRIALATVACALALPASALAAEPAATGAGGVGLKPASGLKVTSLKASKSGRTVTAKVRWDRALIVRKAERERFTVRLLSGPAGQRRVLGTVSRRAPKGTSENVRFRLNARNARRVKSSSRVFATATQQFDSPDTGRLYELNHVSIASMKGKRPFTSAAASSCPTEIKPNTDMTGCQLPGANLAGADLSGVKFNQANLEVSNLASAWLETTDLTQADLTGASLIGAKMSPSEQSARTFPDDGDQIGKLIDSAQTSVDVIIYEIGGQNIVGQPGSPGALMRAVQRGVNVRVIVNSGNKGCTGFEDDKQAVCLGLPGADAYYAVEAALKSAADSARAQGKTPGNYRVQFSSQNYQITHQKSILIDTSD
ncbi:MAG: pentapeptide repeat-containing protein, partial [Solirubrobacterales bacterium]